MRLMYNGVTAVKSAVPDAGDAQFIPDHFFSLFTDVPDFPLRNNSSIMELRNGYV